MSTPTKRPPESSRTPQDTPAAIAREIAQLATAPVHDFVACISDEDTRDHLYQQLVDCLTAERLSDVVPILWSQAQRLVNEPFGWNRENGAGGSPQGLFYESFTISSPLCTSLCWRRSVYG